MFDSSCPPTLLDEPTLPFTAELSTVLPAPADNPTNCIIRHHGKIWLDTDRGRPQVGRFEFIEILLDHSKFSPIEVLDFDPDTSIYKDLFDKEEFSAGVLRRLGQAKDKSECHLNVLLVERFELLPKARGTGLAPRALEHLIQKLGRNSRIAALIPYPLQFSIGDTGDAFSKRMKYDEIAGDVESGERKLRKFYGKVGFVRVPGTDLMIRDLYA